MTRRELLASAGILSTVLMSGASFADNKGASEISKDKLKKAVDTSFDCLKKGEACYSHCLDMLAQGDTSMNNCHPSLQNMMAACTAMTKVGTYGSAKTQSIKHLAAACADLCKECADACKLHAEHAVCKSCMEACNKCVDACNDVAA